MDYKKTAAEAWIFTQQNKKIVWWLGAVPSFFTTMVAIGYAIFQYYSFVSSLLFENWEKSFSLLAAEFAFQTLSNFTYLVVPSIALATIIGLGYLLLPVFCDGALIQLIARKRNGQKVRLRHGITFGLMTFLPLFEYRMLLRTFSVWSIMGAVFMMMRTFGWGIVNFMIPVMIVVMIASFIVDMLLTYTDMYMNIDNHNVFQAIASSCNLVARHFEETIFLTLLMILIGLRIIVQLLFVLLIPALGLGVLYFLTWANLPQLGWLVASVLALAVLIFSSYLNGVIHVFAVTVWTFTFLDLTNLSEVSARTKSDDEEATIS
jgi:hypothetical protein